MKDFCIIIDSGMVRESTHRFSYYEVKPSSPGDILLPSFNKVVK